MNKSRRIKLNTVILHVIGCILFLSIPVFSSLGDRTVMESLNEAHYVEEIMEYALTILFFYLNYFYLVPRFYLRKQYALFIVLALTGCVIVNVLPEASRSFRPQMGHHNPGPPGDDHFRPPPPPPGADIPIPFTDLTTRDLGPFDENFLKYSVVFILAITLKVTSQLRKIQKEKAESEILFLKAQINPHFLFNTLNSIYSLAVEAKAKNTADAVVKLSAMMRYSVSDASSDMVPLAKELTYIGNYISLQRLRMTDDIRFSYEVQGNADMKEIAPFLLIPFVENAFKYGVNVDEDSDISIRIDVLDQVLNLHVVNKKVTVNQTKETGTSIGIANTRKRLELIYPGRHTLYINDTDTTFEVLLNVTL